MSFDIRALNELVAKESAFADRVTNEVSKVIVGQDHMVERILIGLLTGGHVLLEGVPGLAKTLTVRTLCRAVDAKFARVQFTPDLLPADLVGTVIYDQRTGEFRSKLGPIFANLILADEINRAPAKVQSALLEAMQERQVTIGDGTHPLPNPFIVLATQNPIEQEGTYPLPEAQVDRFMMRVLVDYPTRDEERQIMDRMTGTVTPEIRARLHARGALLGAPHRRADVRRRQGEGLHRRRRPRHARPGQTRAQASSMDWSSTARAPAPRSRSTSPRAPARSSPTAATSRPRT